MFTAGYVAIIGITKVAAPWGTGYSHWLYNIDHSYWVFTSRTTTDITVQQLINNNEIR